MEDLVSIIIPVRNGIRHIPATLECVFAQTYRNIEIIVVDDGSTDGTPGMLEAAYGNRIKLIRQPQTGHSAARNTGVRAAAGQYLSFIDHDDLWPARKTTLQMQILADNPEIDLVFGHVQNFLDDEIPVEERQRIAAPMYPLAGLHPGAMLARRAAFERVGPFQETVDMGDFLNWYGRALLINVSTFMLPDVVMRRRIHNTNFSRRNRHLQREYLVGVKQLMDARRLASAQGNA